MYPRNNASPNQIAIGAVVQISDGAVQTSGCTVRILPFGGAEGDGAGTTAYSTDGVVLYTPTQGETNYTSFVLIAKKTGCIPASTTVVTTESAVAGRTSVGMLVGDAQSATDLKDFADAGYDPATHKVEETKVLTTLPNIPNNWLTAAGIATDAIAAAKIAADAVTKIQNGLATSAEVTGLNVNTRANVMVPVEIETPDASTQVFKIRLFLFDVLGNMEAPDSEPTIALVNAAGTDRSGRLSAASNPSTGVYSWDYTATAGDAEEQLNWTFTVVEGGLTRVYPAVSYVVEETAYRFSSSDRATLQAAATATALATAQADLDILTGSDGVTLATTQGNYAPAKAGDEMDLVDAPNATAVTAIQNGLATAANLALVKAVTDALTSAGATKLALSAGVIVAGTVDTGSFSATTTEFEADDITEATADHYIGRIVIFTSGALQYQATDITDYALSGSNGHFTVTTLTEAPGNNDTFIIV
jgi:hypothetical protein